MSDEEDATSILAMSATSRPTACRARSTWRTTWHTDKRAALYTAADRRPTSSGKRVARWTGKSPDILVTSSRGYRACRRGCHEDATKKLLPWNSSCEWYAESLASVGTYASSQCESLTYVCTDRLYSYVLPWCHVPWRILNKDRRYQISHPRCCPLVSHFEYTLLFASPVPGHYDFINETGST